MDVWPEIPCPCVPTWYWMWLLPSTEIDFSALESLEAIEYKGCGYGDEVCYVRGQRPGHWTVRKKQHFIS